MTSDPPVTPGTAETTTRAETLAVDTEWVVAGRVRVRRRIITERRTVEVDVHREVLEIDGDDLDFHNGRLFGVAVGPTIPDVPQPRPPIVLVLREEVPRVEHDLRAYERVTVTTERVTRTETVHDELRREVVDVDVDIRRVETQSH
ncbi:DUF2382 domain-containing protein [Jatrophihabitans sp. YIM 134969]